MKKEGKTYISVWMDEELESRIVQEVKRSHTNKSWIAREAMYEYLDKKEKQRAAAGEQKDGE